MTQSNGVMFENSEQTVNVFTNGWETRLGKQGKLSVSSLAEPLSLAGAASDVHASTGFKDATGR